MTTTSTLVLPVPYESQLDNISGSGRRECFSSTAAMIARFWGRVGSDDLYNRVRSRFGDTTDPLAQVAALRSIGLDVVFRVDGTPESLETELKARRPVAVGWLHHGPSSAPAGGGHWSVVVGFDSRRFCIHDPYGEPDVLNGGHLVGTSGRGVWVSRRNWLPRWQAGGQAWYLQCRGLCPF